MDRQLDLRIALLGNCGSGKSASGNTILNQNRFRENNLLHALPRLCEAETTEEDGRNILVIDTPGLFETSMDEDKLIAEMKTCALQSFPGLHAFLLVIRLDVRLTDEETNIMKWVESFFGEDALRYTFILFTHADALADAPLDEFIRGRPDLQRLINSCGGDRYHAFNNKNRQNRDQVKKLIEKIDRMMNNGGHHNTLQEFKKSEKSRIFWKRAKVAGTVIVIGGLVFVGGVGVLAIVKGGGVVLGKRAGLALLAAVAAAAGKTEAAAKVAEAATAAAGATAAAAGATAAAAGATAAAAARAVAATAGGATGALAGALAGAVAGATAGATKGAATAVATGVVAGAAAGAAVGGATADLFGSTRQQRRHAHSN